MALQPKTYKDFSGGFTDNVVGAAPNQSAIIENFFITEAKTLEQRPGSIALPEATMVSVVKPGGTTGDLIDFNFGAHLLVRSLSNVYVKQDAPGGVWTQLQGPTGNNALVAAVGFTDQSTTNYAEFLNDLYMVGWDRSNNSYVSPMKFYKSIATGNVTVVNAGLPEVPTVVANVRFQYRGALAMALKDNYNLHRLDQGALPARHKALDIFVLGESLVPETANGVDVQRVVKELLMQFAQHDADAALGAGWVYHRGTRTTPITIPNDTLYWAETNEQVLVEALNQVKNSFFLHENDAGAHNIAVPNADIYGPDIRLARYIYAFCYKYEYNGKIDRGPVTTLIVDDVEVPETEVPGGSGHGRTIVTLDLPAFPVSTENYSGATKLEIYRTTANGTAFYKIKEMLISGVPSSTYDDTLESVLMGNEPLYITGGVVDNDPPPKAKTFTIINGIGYYGGVWEDGVFYPCRIRQSHVDDPDAVPLLFSCDVANDVQTIGAAGDYPIVVGKRGVWRIDGYFDELGRGQMTPVRISADVGGVSVNGGASVGKNFYFAGHNGFYVTDGFQVRCMSKHLTTSYAALVTNAIKQNRIRTTFDRDNNRVLWSVCETNPNWNDTIYVLDLNQPLSDEASFIKLNGSSFYPTALAVFNKDLYRGDFSGFVFKHTSGLLTDPKVNYNGGGSLTGDEHHVAYKWRSIADDMGLGAVRKYVPSATFQFANHGNLSIQPKSINDKNVANITSLTAIRFRQEYGGVITEKRTFPAATNASGNSGGHRCSYKQVQLEPARVIMAASDDGLTKASFAVGLLTLDTNQYDGVTPSAYQWPLNCEDWYASFETDNYTAEYLVTNRVSNDTLAIAGNPGAGSKKWVLRGYAKNEKCELIEATVWFTPTGSPQHLPTGDKGANS